jgi:hypothetical protein
VETEKLLLHGAAGISGVEDNARVLHFRSQTFLMLFSQFSFSIAA